jgi:uncharacterized protein GlcG (DUF336 family)
MLATRRKTSLRGGGAGLRYFTVPGVNLMEGGVPIVLDGKIIGAIDKGGKP